jgi:hypothetical protein
MLHVVVLESKAVTVAPVYSILYVSGAYSLTNELAPSVNSLVARKIFTIKVFNIKISSCYIRITCYSCGRAWHKSHQGPFARR